MSKEEIKEKNEAKFKEEEGPSEPADDVRGAQPSVKRDMDDKGEEDKAVRGDTNSPG